QLVRTRKILEELVAQSRILKPVLSEQGLPCDCIASFGTLIGVKQIANKYRIVRESLIGILVQAKVQRRAAAIYLVEISFEIGAVEALDRILGQLFEIGVSFIPKIVAREFVVPEPVRETRNRTPVDFLLFGAQAILIQKNREPLVEAGVVGVAVDLLPKNCQCIGDSLHLDQSRQIAV